MARKATNGYQQSNGASRHRDGTVHSIGEKIEEQAELLARNPQEQKEAGVIQLLVCVGGIYASL
jgi:UDP-galactose transporter B1